MKTKEQIESALDVIRRAVETRVWHSLREDYQNAVTGLCMGLAWAADAEPEAVKEVDDSLAQLRALCNKAESHKLN